MNEIIIAGENPKGNKEICYCRKEKEMMDGEQIMKIRYLQGVTGIKIKMTEICYLIQKTSL